MEVNVEKLIEKIVAEVIKELADRGIQVIPVDNQYRNTCSCKVEKINPSNCKTSDLNKEYVISIKAEVNDFMAL